MTISYNWLCDYLPVKPSPDEVSEMLTSVGLEVEEMQMKEAVKGGLQGLVIGKVLTCIPHPNADKLRVTTVNIGVDIPLQIVCGAPNVSVGQTVVVATVGTTIYPLSGEPFMIKKAKIRGEESEGMICAEDEIGLGDNHDGIIILPDTISIGSLAKDYYQIAEPEIIYEIGLTPNRMDAMSHLGVAQDICAYIANRDQKSLQSQVPQVQLTETKNKLPIHIQIEDETRCARYAGIVISNCKVADSPEWLANKLKSIDLRPINNIVDITNFVLHECGQPLHAFDYDAIKGQSIIVKTLPAKTKFVSLDSQERELHAEDLMICNADEAMCIAGVFGGLHSGVSDKTTTIFLESAWFENQSIRLTSLRHGLRTDAAVRFEKGADISKVPYALQRAAQLIQEICGGEIASEMIDVYPNPFAKKEIALSTNKIRGLAGKNYSNEQIKNILLQLGFEILEETEDELRINVPYSKPDITMQADVVEEIMRIDGLDNIPFTGKISYSLPAVSSAYQTDTKSQVAQYLVGKGLQEIFTNSITNSAFYPNDENLVVMMNNLSAELNCMRPSMLESGLQAMAYNLNRKNQQLQFFEFGKTYHSNGESFIENEKLCLYFSGNYRSDSWKEKSQAIDFYYVKGILDSVLQNMKLEVNEDNGLYQLLFQRKKIGSIQSVSNERLALFAIKAPVWFIELDWQMIKLFYQKQKLSFKGIPKFPLMQRDLALILDKQVSYQSVQIAVKQAKSKLLQNMNLFDVFESDKLGEGKKSYAINLSFYDDSKTLTDIEVDEEMKQIINALETKVGAAIRGN
ncbi:MAG: phenylalanine--tRNA ligase subunit beta [Bacteroidetes bacterium]|nr:phenylalanine--tRNA ligase subunit beta [Bacteroidota bacterium]